MIHRKLSSSSLRYFLAGLKPLGRPTVWGTIGIMALASLSIWQYFQHPEWLSGDIPISETGELNDEVGNNLDVGVDLQDFEETPSEIPLTPNAFNESVPQSTGELPVENSETRSSPLPDSLSEPLNSETTSNQNIEETTQQQFPQFQPLIPSFNNLNSLFPSISPTASNPSEEASKPIKLPDLQPLNLGTPENNPLKNALDKTFSKESPKTIEQNPELNETNSGKSSPERQSQQNSQRPPLAKKTVPSSPQQPGNNLSQGSGNQSYPQPYNNPYNSNQTNAQSYNNPYDQSIIQPYNNPYGTGIAPTPIPVSPQSSQSSRNPNTNLNPDPYGQSRQRQRQNNYGIQEPQIDPFEGHYSY
ncbi:MAG: hypothetical protein AAGF26_13440 [Cyanobacteria bacterium P01_G01_bin.49]